MMTSYDAKEMLNEMGICPTCHDHTPCGCEYDFTPISNVLGNAIEKLTDLLPKEKLFECEVCGMANTIDEADMNDDKCFNCNSQL